MKLLCLGDIAISENDLPNLSLSTPNGIVPDSETRILINWELPIGSKFNPLPRSSGPRHKADPASPSLLRSWAPSYATLATNHILDTGEDGLVSTISALHKVGFATLGAGMTDADIARPLIWETLDSGTLAIVNWVFPETNPDWMQVPGGNCWPGIKKARGIIQELKLCADWVMVVTHWSDELFPYPRPAERVIAQDLAEAGTDILIGHHPHVVRGMEDVGGCLVFYSLGNYYCSEFSNRWAPRSREALGILLSFTKGCKPKFQVLSFWQEKRNVVQDPWHRAVRRMNQTSKVFKRFHDLEYDRWYGRERLQFDRFWAKWHFGARRLGIAGVMKHMWNKFVAHK